VVVVGLQRVSGEIEVHFQALKAWKGSLHQAISSRP